MLNPITELSLSLPKSSSLSEKIIKSTENFITSPQFIDLFITLESLGILISGISNLKSYPSHSFEKTTFSCLLATTFGMLARKIALQDPCYRSYVNGNVRR